MNRNSKQQRSSRLFFLLAIVVVLAAGIALDPYTTNHPNQQTRTGTNQVAQSAHRLHQNEAVLFHSPRAKSNWAGWAISPFQTGAVTDVKGQWVVPTVNCSVTPTGYSSAWVGIDGDTNNTVEQIGTEQDCIKGQPSYYAWYELYPKNTVKISSIVVHPGATMTAEVIYKGNGQFTLTLQTFSTTQTSTNGQEQSAEWIVEGFGTKLADFGTIAFSGAQATINGLTGSISAWSQSHSYDMSSKSNTVQATTSGLTPDGSGFTVTWQHA